MSSLSFEVSSLSFEVSHSVARQEVREIAGDGVFVEQETLLMLKTVERLNVLC